MTGKDVSCLDQEGGNVRIQRIPRTEKRGRVHTSTVTVAVLGKQQVDISPYLLRSKSDFDIEWYNGTIGAGGQKHNKTATCARIRHLPTGIVRTAQTRSRKNSEAEAMAALNKDLDDAMTAKEHGSINHARKTQIGSGQRASEKKRTFRFQENRAYDHATGKTANLQDVMKGRIEKLMSDPSVR